MGPILKWKRDDLRSALGRLKLAAYASLLIAIVTLAVTFGHKILTIVVVTFFMALAAWLVFGSMAVLIHRTRLGAAPLATSLKLARTTPLAFYGLILAHAGMGVTVAGITGMTTFATEKIEMLRPGQSLQLSGYEVRLRSVGSLPGPNYEAERGDL